MELITAELDKREKRGMARPGHPLALNVSLSAVKTCTYDCIYCRLVIPWR